MMRDRQTKRKTNSDAVTIRSLCPQTAILHAISLRSLAHDPKIGERFKDVPDYNKNVIEFIQQFHPVTQALIATLFTWSVTAAGAALVFFRKTLDRKLLDAMLGFAAGVMIAASFWSLLAPGIEMAKEMGQTPWLTAL